MSAHTKKRTKPKTKRKPAAKPRTARKPTAAPKTPETPAPPPLIKKAPIAETKSYLLAIRLKGSFGTPRPLQKALETLRLKAKFNAVLLENTPTSIGMLRKVKDYVTWGEVRTDDIANVLRERGEFSGGTEMTDETIQAKFGEPSIQELASALTQGKVTLRDLQQKGLNPVFRLRAPSGGFEKSGKRPYGSGGELGRRQAALSTLISRMT